MSRPLTKQELHNLAMNIVGKDLQAKGYEFIAINSKLKKHPQYVCVDKNNIRYFVLVKAIGISDNPITYDVIWMETFKNHAQKNNAKIIFAGVGLGAVNNKSKPPTLNEEYLLQYDGLQFIDVQLN
ncbi:Na(+)-translocating NADH-quinone reductase subunit F [Lutibacter profundi]|uniref:Na(+)-translocating NADH-quinone reductase subunit F n=1 Tax=Lutibacter profundi TaxID=1622118 RepID=A0A0X8G6M4_9FLAO|nr:Na(+)-translocating NADH-quinone reductase subunit F [Lutibacter profundi]AMC10994.1 Na(+)-translocating NADH-quinone reductase subunit F [Lutibacter profundi]